MASRLDCVSNIPVEFLDILEAKLRTLEVKKDDKNIKELLETASVIMYRIMERNSGLSVEEMTVKLGRVANDLVLQWMAGISYETAWNYLEIIEPALADAKITLSEFYSEVPIDRGSKLLSGEGKNKTENSEWKNSLRENFIAHKFGQVIADFLSEIAPFVTDEGNQIKLSQFQDLGEAIMSALIEADDEFLEWPECVYEIMLNEARKIFNKSIFLTLLRGQVKEDSSN